jgi:membrane-associated phospholipid phosphatase
MIFDLVLLLLKYIQFIYDIHSFLIALNQLIQAKRPVEFNKSYQPKTNILENSFGFPSIESYMCVVILFLLIYMSQLWWWSPICVFICFIIGFSRLYSKSRFFHQVIGSWALGFISLLISIKLSNSFDFKVVTDVHIILITVVVSVLIVVFAVAIETNQSLLMALPEADVIRVLANTTRQNKQSVS